MALLLLAEWLYSYPFLVLLSFLLWCFGKITQICIQNQHIQDLTVLEMVLLTQVKASVGLCTSLEAPEERLFSCLLQLLLFPRPLLFCLWFPVHPQASDTVSIPPTARSLSRPPLLSGFHCIYWNRPGWSEDLRVSQQQTYSPFALQGLCTKLCVPTVVV